jgi:DNA-binding CsgD family transcriptional regulator
MITENQCQILLRLFAGSTVNEIATATGRKPSTIANTLRLVRAQMGARRELDLLRECLRRDLVTLDEILTLADVLRGEQDAQADESRGARKPLSDSPKRE